MDVIEARQAGAKARSRCRCGATDGRSVFETFPSVHAVLSDGGSADRMRRFRAALGGWRATCR